MGDPPGLYIHNHCRQWAEIYFGLQQMVIIIIPKINNEFNAGIIFLQFMC